MFPLKDLQPRRSAPVITLLLIITNALVFLYQISLTPRQTESFILKYSAIPANISLALSAQSPTSHHHISLTQALLPLFTSMFLHAGWLHILSNMWFLWIFGANVEDRMGSARFLIFYILCGLGSSIAQTLFSWGSHIPALGASGAISGVLGAYVVFFPRAKILTLVPLFIIWFLAKIPALVFIGLWFLIQFISGVSSLGAASAGGVAWWAHVGGFLMGLALANLLASGSNARQIRRRPPD